MYDVWIHTYIPKHPAAALAGDQPSVRPLSPARKERGDGSTRIRFDRKARKRRKREKEEKKKNRSSRCWGCGKKGQKGRVAGCTRPLGQKTERGSRWEGARLPCDFSGGLRAGEKERVQSP